MYAVKARKRKRDILAGKQLKNFHRAAGDPAFAKVVTFKKDFYSTSGMGHPCFLLCMESPMLPASPPTPNTQHTQIHTHKHTRFSSSIPQLNRHVPPP